MDKLFIATSSLNLNNILATESISPESFYSRRSFGYKRFNIVAPNPLANSLIAYDKIPYFEINETDFDEYPLIIEISKELIKDDALKNIMLVDDINIFQLTNTIYLHPNKTRFLFFNEKDKKTALIKTEPSIETKLVPVYNSRISVIENNNSFRWNKLMISNIKDIVNNEMPKNQDFDSKINKTKGFYYSYLLGMILSDTLNEKTKQEEYESFVNFTINLLNQKKKISLNEHNIIEELESINFNISKYISVLKEESKRNINPLLLIENLNINGHKITQLSDIFFKNNDADLYRNIINEIFDYPITDIQSFKEEKVNLAYKIGVILKEYISDWENSKERDYFNCLMDNIENYKPFDLKSHSSRLLQSIALFIQKGEEPEKLLDSLKKNKISDFRIALGLWGSIFGFSALPKTLTNILFDNKYIEVTRKLYQDVQVKLHKFSAENFSSFESLSPSLFIYKQNVQLEEKVKKEKSTLIISQDVVEKDFEQQIKVINTHQDAKPKCPKCGSDMVLRDGKFGKFYGCSKYGYSESSCDGTLQLKDIPVRNESKKVLSDVILECVKINGCSKLSDLIPFIKEKINIKYNITNIESHIKDYLIEELEFTKLEKSTAKAVKFRDKGMFK